MSIPMLFGRRPTIGELSNAMVLDILKGEECFHCGEAKRRMNAHDYRCYRMLPPKMQRSLRCRFGQGFEDAYRTSLEWLARNKVSKDDLVFGPIVTKKENTI